MKAGRAVDVSAGELEGFVGFGGGRRRREKKRREANEAGRL
jgi:hypothetical protein